ncbi:hypothetical protein ACFQX7_33445 [Luedemannella flava]
MTAALRADARTIHTDLVQRVRAEKSNEIRGTAVTARSVMVAVPVRVRDPGAQARSSP